MNAILTILILTAILCGNLQAAIQAVGAERVSTRPEPVVTTLGFGSCARQERPQPIWDAINAARCDAFVLCGDNIYADTADPAVFRGKYALLAAMPGFAKLRQTTPLFATWDDHDYGLNDGGAGFPGAAASQREFCDFFQVPADFAPAQFPRCLRLRHLRSCGQTRATHPAGYPFLPLAAEKRPMQPEGQCPEHRRRRNHPRRGTMGVASSAVFANPPKSVPWSPAFHSFQPNTDPKNGRTSHRNAPVSSNSFTAHKPGEWLSSAATATSRNSPC